ncbi:MAG: sulfotransferase domain-containing protein [Actinomycetota bacterium]
MQRLIDGIKRAARLTPPGRDVRIRDGDVLLTSYPRSGNTWLRFLLANLLRPDVTHTLETLARVVPDIYKTSARNLERIPDPRVMKSHEYFDPRYPRMIYLVRDPRDVAVSFFHYQRDRGGLPPSLTIDEWMPTYLRGAGSRHGSWKEHVESWLATRGDSPSLLLLRYEDLVTDPTGELARIAGLLGVEWTRAETEQAIARSSMTKLRAAEARSRDATPGTTARRGVAGAWTEELPRPSIEAIETNIGDTMQKLSYDMTI